MIYPSERSQPVNAPPPCVSARGGPGGERSLPGPVVIVGGAAGGRVHVSRGRAHVVVVRVSADPR